MAGVEHGDEPELPGPRWLRVKNRQCGICATDIKMVYANGDPGIAPVALPGIDRIYLGHEAVGEVVEVGAEVTSFRVGDRVALESRPTGAPNCLTQEISPPCRFCARGDTRLCENNSLGVGPQGVGAGWADSYTAHESEVWPVPEDLDDDQASLIEPIAGSVHSVLRRLPEPGDQVLVISAGIIGLLTLQAVKALAPEAHVTVMARYSHQGEAARRLGADEVISDRGDLYAKIAEITNANLYRAPLNRGMLLGGFDVIYDCISSGRTLTDALRWARANGTVVTIGTSYHIEKVDLSPTWYQQVNLLGSYTAGMEHLNGRTVHTFDLAIELLQEGAIKTDGLITHRFPFDQYRKAIETSIDKRTGSIKVTLTFP